MKAKHTMSMHHTEKKQIRKMWKDETRDRGSPLQFNEEIVKAI